MKKEPLNSCFSCENAVIEVPIEGTWLGIHKIEDINGLSHGIGKCPPQQGACKLTLNVKKGVVEEALIETIGCSGITQSAVIASEILIGKTILEALNCHLVCNAIDDAMKQIFLQFVYGRTQTAFSDNGLNEKCTFEELAKGGRSFVGTVTAGKIFGPRPLETAEGYIVDLALDNEKCIIGYKYFEVNRFLSLLNSNNIKIDDFYKTYGRYEQGVFFINPREVQ